MTIGRHLVIAIFGPILYVFLNKLCKLMRSLTAGFTSVQEPVYDFVVFFAQRPKHTVHSAGKTKLSYKTTAAYTKKTERKLATLLHRGKPSQQD